jgi:hypothetical protein
MPHTAAEKRRAAEALWLDPEFSEPEVARRSRVALPTLRVWAKKYGWPQRPALRTPPDPLAPQRPTGTGLAEKKLPKKRLAKKRLSPADSSSTVRSPARPDKTESLADAERNELIDRLYRLVHHNLKALESRMSDETGTDADPERETRVIGNVVRNVEKLKELEAEQSKRDSVRPGQYHVTPEEEDRIRRKVVAHILRLRERKRRERPDGSDR